MAGTEIANEVLATCSLTMQIVLMEDKGAPPPQPAAARLPATLPGARRLNQRSIDAPTRPQRLGEEHRTRARWGPAGIIPQLVPPWDAK